MIITELWRRQPGQYFCISTKSASGKWRDTFFKRNELSKVPGFLKDNKDKDCYFCVHGLEEKSRLKQYAAKPKMLWSDMDEADPRSVTYKPTIAIESSPGRYVGLWMIDETMTESLNRRLNHAIEAGDGGWDLSQVLRIPGTRNYKYQSTPQVRLMWDDGPVYRFRDLDRKLPEDEQGEGEETDQAMEVFSRNDKVMKATTKQLLTSKVAEGKRSEVFWKLVNCLVEDGITRADAFVLLRSAKCNKFAGRPSEVQQINRELDKVYKGKLRVIQGGKEIKEKKNGYNMLRISMNEVEEKQPSWIWRPYLARGEVTLFEGDPAIGKSYIMQMVSKAVCDGDILPCPHGKKVRLLQGKVAYFDTENNAGTVTKMRLKWNGCKNMQNFFQEEEPFTLDNEEARAHMFEALEKLRPALVVFDTINLYIGKADIAKSNEAAQAIMVFREIATRFNCAVVMIRHLTKSGGVKAMYRGQGNIAISAMPRIILTIGADPEEPDVKALCHTKLSFAPNPGGIRFTIDSLPDTLKESDRSKLTWGDYDAALHSDDIISVEGRKKEGSDEREGAKAFLEETLDEGPMLAKEIITMAEKRAISPRTLQRAADALGVVRKSTGFGAGKAATWSLANMSRD